jgi:hypothetical protein
MNLRDGDGDGDGDALGVGDPGPGDSAVSQISCGQERDVVGFLRLPHACCDAPRSGGEDRHAALVLIGDVDGAVGADRHYAWADRHDAWAPARSNPRSTSSSAWAPARGPAARR